MTPAERPFDTIESLSQWLKCSRGTVYNLMAEGNGTHLSPPRVNGSGPAVAASR
jgi:hypothetical protein